MASLLALELSEILRVVVGIIPLIARSIFLIKLGAAGLELACRAGLGAGLPRPLSQLRPVDGQFRVQDREGGSEGVLATSHTVSDD